MRLVLSCLLKTYLPVKCERATSRDKSECSYRRPPFSITLEGRKWILCCISTLPLTRNPIFGLKSRSRAPIFRAINAFMSLLNCENIGADGELNLRPPSNQSSNTMLRIIDSISGWTLYTRLLIEEGKEKCINMFWERKHKLNMKARVRKNEKMEIKHKIHLRHSTNTLRY